MDPVSIKATTGTMIIGQDYGYAVSRGYARYYGKSVQKYVELRVSVEELRIEGGSQPVGIGLLGWHRHQAFGYFTLVDATAGRRLHSPVTFLSYENRCAFSWAFGIGPITFCRPGVNFPETIFDRSRKLAFFPTMRYGHKYRVEYWTVAISEGFLSNANTVVLSKRIKASISW
jgi:hypothetical protein